MKVLYAFLFVAISCIQVNDVSFEKVITDLGNLETYIKDYIKEKSYKESTLSHLIICYIRLGAYTTQEWTIAGGTIPDDLAAYIKAKDEEKGTTAQATQTYRDMVMPNGDKLDFVHMFAVMNGIENGKSYSKNYAHLVGWGGDTEQLLVDIMKQPGDIDNLMKIAKTSYFRIKGGFDEADLIADLDAPILLKKKNDDNNFADFMKIYYNEVRSEKERVTQFVDLTFPSLKDQNDKDKFRNEIFNIYTNDLFIKILECKARIRNAQLSCYLPDDIKVEYVPHQKAAVYVVSDYFFENYNKGSDSSDSSDSRDSSDSSGRKDGDSKFLNNNLIYLVSLFGLLIN